MASLIFLIPTGVAFGVGLAAGLFCGHFELHNFSLNILSGLCVALVCESAYVVVKNWLLRRQPAGRAVQNDIFENLSIILIIGSTIGLFSGFFCGYMQYWLGVAAQHVDASIRALFHPPIN